MFQNLVIFCLLFLSIFAYKTFSFGNDWGSFSNPMVSQDNRELFINNKVLFKVKDHTITVVDVIHKMNLLFYKSYPHLIHSNVSKFQFYTGLWPVILEAVIDDFLIFADAEEKKISIEHTDVKKEIENLFGNKLINVISAFGMTEKDVFKIVKRDLIVQKMLGYMVRSKASMFVSPNKIKEAYKERLKSYIPERCWSYIILTLESPCQNETLAFAEEIYKSIANAASFEEKEIFQKASQKNIEIKISNVLKGSETSLSQMHKDILMNIENNLCSEPISYKKNKVRLFVVKEFFLSKLQSFSELEEQLHIELLEKFTAEQELIYREKLRERYAFHKDMLAKEVVSNELISELFSWATE